MDAHPLCEGAGPAGPAPVGPVRGRSARQPAHHVGVPAQLAALALVWGAGAGFLLVRGGLLATAGHSGALAAWAVPVVMAGVLVGALKARAVLRPYAARAVLRVRARGRSSALGFLAPRSWAFVVVMMGTGILLRHSALAQGEGGRALLCGLYVAVGTSLAAADLVVLGALWAALRPDPAQAPSP